LTCNNKDYRAVLPLWKTGTAAAFNPSTPRARAEFCINLIVNLNVRFRGEKLPAQYRTKNLLSINQSINQQINESFA